MSKTNYTPGETVYLLNGQTAKYIAPDGEGHIVRPILEAYHGDDSWEEEGNPTSVESVFSNPPTDKLHAEIAELNATIAAKEARLSEIAEQEEKIKDSERERSLRLKKHEALRLIDDYLAGKIRYLVTGVSPDRERISIIDTQSPRMNCGEDNKHYLDRSRMRLLSLFGGENRKAWWELNRYSDDSGTSHLVAPCVTLEEAETKAREIFTARIEAWRADKERKNFWEAKLLSDSATALKLDFPDDIRIALADDNRKDAEKKVAEAERALEAAKAARAAITQAEGR